ncbi:CD27 antigen [Heterocephalus glaber]|uniref:CD27 antigen n=1 Tax=Heterocephalus glaber TaxID=10181 RepID=A0AAX6S3G7_HETGA|nr:CD27 antigen [Heterocephalus glaber]
MAWPPPGWLFVLGALAVLSATPAPGSCPERLYRSPERLCCQMCRPGTFLVKDCDQDLAASQCDPCKPGLSFAPDYHSRRHCESCRHCHWGTPTHNCSITANTECACPTGHQCRDSECTECDPLPDPPAPPPVAPGPPRAPSLSPLAESKFQPTPGSSHRVGWHLGQYSPPHTCPRFLGAHSVSPQRCWRPGQSGRCRLQLTSSRGRAQVSPPPGQVRGCGAGRRVAGQRGETLRDPMRPAAPKSLCSADCARVVTIFSGMLFVFALGGALFLHQQRECGANRGAEPEEPVEPCPYSCPREEEGHTVPVQEDHWKPEPPC